MVYVGSDDGNVYALNAATGAKLWNYTTSGAVSSPAVSNGVVYVGSSEGASRPVYVGSSEGNVYALEGNVYALNATTGAKLWCYTTGDDVDSSPAVANGVVYVGSGDGNVYAIGTLIHARVAVVIFEQPPQKMASNRARIKRR